MAARKGISYKGPAPWKGSPSTGTTSQKITWANDRPENARMITEDDYCDCDPRDFSIDRIVLHGNGVAR